MKKKQKGFIPIPFMVLIGLVVITGGVSTVLTQKNKQANETAPASVLTADKESIASHELEADLEQMNNTPITNPNDFNPETIGVSLKMETDIPLETEAEQRAILVSDEIKEICTKDKEYLLEKPLSNAGKLEREIKHQELTLVCQRVLHGDNADIEYIKKQEKIIESSWKDLQEIANWQEPEQTTYEEDETETYATSPTYPIILSFTDNHGDTYKVSSYNGYEGPYSTRNKVTLRVGDTITATVKAEDPQGRSLEYNWNSNSGPFRETVEATGDNYTPSNKLTYTLTHEDLVSTGESFRLVYQVRVAGADYYRFGGGQYDDVGFIDYRLEE
ncbi:MAG: hypothetical protein K9M36_02580 [Candidatus Pacebacteria bacterium]|nr:hypothetical protein [Candidatus Paceibacterota bacterium]